MGIKVIIFEDGKAIITSEGRISRDQAQAIVQYFKEWRDSDRGVLVINEAEVINGVKSIELDIPEA